MRSNQAVAQRVMDRLARVVHEETGNPVKTTRKRIRAVMLEVYKTLQHHFLNESLIEEVEEKMSSVYEALEDLQETVDGSVREALALSTRQNSMQLVQEPLSEPSEPLEPLEDVAEAPHASEPVEPMSEPMEPAEPMSEEEHQGKNPVMIEAGRKSWETRRRNERLRNSGERDKKHESRKKDPKMVEAGRKSWETRRRNLKKANIA